MSRPMGPTRPERARNRVLAAVGEAGAEAVVARGGRRVRLRALDGTPLAGLPAKGIETALLDDIVRLGLVDRDGTRLTLTPLGHARLARQGVCGFLAQHGAVEEETRIGPDGEPATVLVDAAESPVAWLARPRRPGEAPFLAEGEVAAADQLRSDVEIGRLGPRLTTSWGLPIGDKRGSGERGGGADLTDAALAARRRVDAALADAGPEFAGVLLDVCGFLKKLEVVEVERGWPARSAKLVLKLGLARLARHYGLVKPPRRRAGRLTHWGAPDYRPRVQP